LRGDGWAKQGPVAEGSSGGRDSVALCPVVAVVELVGGLVDKLPQPEWPQLDCLMRQQFLPLDLGLVGQILFLVLAQPHSILGHPAGDLFGHDGVR